MIAASHPLPYPTHGLTTINAWYLNVTAINVHKLEPISLCKKLKKKIDQIPWLCKPCHLRHFDKYMCIFYISSFPGIIFNIIIKYLSIFIISKIGILNCLIEDQITVFSVEDNFSTWYLKKSACLHQVLLCNQTTGNYQLKIYILQLIIFLKIFWQKKHNYTFIKILFLNGFLFLH